MYPDHTTLRKSQEILHSSLIFLIGACAAHVFFVSSSLRLGIPLLVFMFIALKICLYSGAYGCMAALASDESVSATFKDFCKSVKRYGLLFLGLTILQFALEAGVKLLLADVYGLAPRFDIFFFDILILYIMAHTIMVTAYLKPLGLPRRPISLKTHHILTLGALYIINAFLRNINLFVSLEDSIIFVNAPILLHVYIHFLIFLYLVTIILETYPEIPKRLNKDKRLYLVNPLSGGVLIGLTSAWQRSYPPVFVVLKALSPKHYKTKEFNRVHWKDRFYAKDKLVAITCFTSNSAEAYKIAKEFRRRGAKVVMGGPHVTYLPDEALEFCDSVVVGEAESVWKDIIKDYENGSLKPKYMGVALDDFHSEVHKELMNSPPEIVKDFLETTRGCKFRCAFCTIPSLSGGKARKKPVGEIVELIKKVKDHYPNVGFIDNNIYSDPQYAKELFTALKPLKIKWGTQCTIDIAKNEETLRLAKESGCKQFLFGYEIFGGSLEKQQGGKFALADKYIKFTQKIKKAGIKIKAHFIYGFDSDTIKNSLTLWGFCFRIRPLFTSISLLTPLPGSQTYYEMLAQNRIMNFNWRSYDCQNLVFEHTAIKSWFLKVLFPTIKYTYFLTTSHAGQCILALILADYIFFGFQHM